MALGAQRGSAIWFLFLGVALFGALAYAFLQGSRSNVGMVTGEAAKVAGYQSQDCLNAVNMGMKRLQARGCADLISLETDGSNPHTGAPVDGSCSVYHANGGGVAPCNSVIAENSSCTTGPVGTVCTSDGAIYIGTVAGNRIYAAPTDAAGSMHWGPYPHVTGAVHPTDGMANSESAMIVSAGASIYPAIWACRNRSPAGTWYLPAISELSLFWTNGNRRSPPGPLDLSAIAIEASSFYWSSTEASSHGAHTRNLGNGSLSAWTKNNNSHRVRCVRR